MELRLYLQTILDQVDQDDALLKEATFDHVLDRCRALARGKAEALVTNVPDDDAEFSEDNEDSPLVTITLKDLFVGTSIDRTTYYFRPLLPIHAGHRIVMVDDVEISSGWTYDATLCELTFSSQRVESSPVVQLQGFLVDWRLVMKTALQELELCILSTPDLYGSHRKEWLNWVRTYRNVEFGAMAGG